MLTLCATFIILYMIYKIIVVPYQRLRFYKEQGADIYFYPLIGGHKVFKESLAKWGDSNYEGKLLIKAKPDLRMFATNIATTPVLVLIDPVLIKEFSIHYQDFPKSQRVLAIFHLLLGKTGLLLAEGDMWKKKRRFLSRRFNYESLKAFIPGVLEVVKEIYDRMEKSDMTRVPLNDEFQKITGENIGRIFAGKSLTKYKFHGNDFPVALFYILEECSEVAQSPWFLLFGADFIKQGKTPRFKRLMGDITSFRQLCQDILNERKEALKKDPEMDKKSTTFLDAFLRTQSSSRKEDAFSDLEIVDEMMSFFFAGTDTTGHLASTVIINLIKNPQYIDKVLEEINTHYKDQEITIDNLARMEFLSAIIKETLRYNTPVSQYLVREVTQDQQISDVKIQAGTVVLIGLVANNWNPKYNEKPEKFDPDRWLYPKDKERKNDPFSYIPFSAGPRNCIGQHLAMLELKIMISEFILRYSFKFHESFKLRWHFKLMYTPVDRLFISLEKRS